jgi:predicted small lipoprotein YifL
MALEIRFITFSICISLRSDRMRPLLVPIKPGPPAAGILKIMKCLQRGTIIVALGGLLLACGQKGPLLLPDAPKHKRTVPPLASPVKPNGSSAPSAPNPAGEPNGPSAPAAAPANNTPTAPASNFNGSAPTSLTPQS